MLYDSTSSLTDSRKGLSALLAAVKTLAPVVRAGESARWERSQSASRLDDGTSASVDGEHSDPTGDTAADPARAELSDALRNLERVWLNAAQHTEAAGKRVEAALAAWESSRDRTAA